MGAKKPAGVEQEIRDSIASDPAFTDTSKLILDVTNGGSLFKKKVKVSLSGSLPTKTQKEKLERWIENKYGDSVDLESSLTIG
ncbi:hypothetical protein [Spirochaeta africana]|uniref:Uncharacterized protein n=1 Tax=Spirochaeta africana (strain ATCC 700263 / DSM 8902 / Z-7692) TaxID=889378 RepID=H9UI58_SPIAZ|nr:hypothetical protein [Spirochaeta africana]AFG37201.1 hypothetical protein Spiaf_1114 [Spirochaeta africana DSM 8902]